MLVAICDIGTLVPGIIFATKSVSMGVQPMISEEGTAVVGMSIEKGGMKLGEDATSPIGTVLKASGGPEYGFISCRVLCDGRYMYIYK